MTTTDWFRCALSTCAVAALFVPRSAGTEEPRNIPLWPEGVPGQRSDPPAEVTRDGYVTHVHAPSLAWYPAPGAEAGTAVIVCPGGGYSRLAYEHSGVEPARWLQARGVNVFVIKYRHAPYRHPAPLQDVLRAVRLVRSRAVELGVRADRVGVMGFSAGGHLAACAGTLFESPEGRTGAELDATSARPDFLVLIYPVITLHGVPGQSERSRRNLLGPKPPAALIDRLSVDQQVTTHTPPAFLVATFEDKVVPAQNSIRFFDAMHRAGVPAELHLFEQGPHGFGLQPGHGPTSDWPKLLEAWMRAHDWLTAP